MLKKLVGEFKRGWKIGRDIHRNGLRKTLYHSLPKTHPIRAKNRNALAAKIRENRNAIKNGTFKSTVVKPKSE